MSRNGTDLDRPRALTRGPRARRRLALLACSLLLLPAAVVAAEAPPEPAELELTPEVRSELARLQESWLKWLEAVYQEDAESTDLALAEMQSGAARMGLRRLPDLSLGAAARAVVAAAADAPEQADLALVAAERLDPGLAEPEFARALVAGARGQRSLAALVAVRHIVGSSLLTQLTLANLGLWFLATLLVAGIAFVAVQMATRGQLLIGRLFGWLSPHMPTWASYLLTLVLLLWPLALPAGPMVLVVYWAILLWGHGARFERWVLAGLLLLLGLAPLLVNEQRKRLGMSLSTPVLAVEDVRTGRLSGTLFSDLGVLRAILPESTAVRQLLADVHVMLGQWPLGRDLYLQVLDEEPNRSTAWVGAGVCFFHLGDFDRAIELFRQAVVADPANAMAHFDLSQTYSELLRFEESARALGDAQRLAPQRVGRWIREAAESRVIASGGGLERAAQIRRQIGAAWRSGEVKPSWVLSLPPAVLFVAIAMVLHLLIPAGRSSAQPVGGSPPPNRWARTFLPGYAEIETRRHSAAITALLVPCALLALPLVASSAFRLPWLLVPGRQLSWWVTLVGLVLWAAIRFLRQTRGRVRISRGKTR
jgi:tetratricopeptide (TPR) repeat protein